MSVPTLKDGLDSIRDEFDKAFQTVTDSPSLERLRIRFLGRKGRINDLFKQVPDLAENERRLSGKAINDLKNELQKTLESRFVQFGRPQSAPSFFDTTLPGTPWPAGRIHPLSKVLREIKSCFQGMGFAIAQGLEVETDYYNFEALNIPKGHPARDMQDSLYVRDNVVLRTHTSPVQVRVMEQQQPPVRIIAPGRCYRRDTPDATHSPVFHQVEGLCVNEGVSLADLKGVIWTFAKRMFGSDMKIRFRPSYFPFTEPSAEYDFSCMMCRGKGCRLCKNTGWIEISGAGMVNPAVFERVRYDTERFTGYAFGMGVERIALLLYEVPDIRMFYENDIRFLNQF
ncbi:MAG TPA: phenylalanine--tRNA ligase subunit alpha [bacterium]